MGAPEKSACQNSSEKGEKGEGEGEAQEKLLLSVVRLARPHPRSPEVPKFRSSEAHGLTLGSGSSTSTDNGQNGQ